MEMSKDDSGAMHLLQLSAGEAGLCVTVSLLSVFQTLSLQ